MRLLWQIEDTDIRKIRAFYDARKNNAFVLKRVERNVKSGSIEFSREIFWKAMISCLITTQQRSGPNSLVTKFICTHPFPLNYSKCKVSNDLEKLVEKIIGGSGLRRAKTISDHVKHNFDWLEGGGWQCIKNIFKELENNQDAGKERSSAEIITDSLKGFGPKQSRNLLQSLGLTKFEIPLDSRIVKWLVEFGFPMKLSATALADKNYYNFILNGFQKLCEEAKIYPCMMDAAIFASFDEEWSEEKLVW